jgi:hypothetical protein
MVADNPDQKIEFKTFCAEIINDHQLLNKEHKDYREVPIIMEVKKNDILENYLRIKKDIQTIIDAEMERILDTPELNSRIVGK